MDEIVKQFIKYTKAAQMPSFFQKLQGKIKEQENAYVFLVTRKGYWSYKLIVHANPELKIEDGRVFSDRYLMKAAERKLLQGKTVYLVDDTMTHGFNLFRYFCIMKKAGAEDVIPAVYALSTEFPRKTLKEPLHQIYYEVNGIFPENVDENTERKAEETRKRFIEKLYCYRYLNQDNISKLCLAETELFQKTLCPFVIDLPMLVSRQEGGKVLEDTFTLSKSQFDRLCVDTREWSYIPNSFGENPKDRSDSDSNFVKNSCLNTIIQCNYFEYHDEWTEIAGHSFLQNAIVKCKYNIDQDGNYHLIFIPFAMVRSCKKTELLAIFKKLAGETDYGKKILKQSVDDLTEQEWIGVFRAVIYILSLYISEKFRSHLMQIGVFEIGYDWEIMKENSEEDFRQSMIAKQREVQKNTAFPEIASLHSADKAKTIGRESNEWKESFWLDDAYKYISQLIQEQNYQIEDRENNVQEKSYRKKCLSIEDIEQSLSNQYKFENEIQRRRAATSIIELMLETSVCGNYIYVSGENIIRSFRHGENSDLLISKEELLCHICVDVLYISFGREKYLKYREQYLNNMESVLVKEGFFEGEVSKAVFERYLDMVLSVDMWDVHYKIMGKRFLVRNLKDPGLIRVQDLAIDEAEKIAAEESKNEE